MDETLNKILKYVEDALFEGAVGHCYDDTSYGVSIAHDAVERLREGKNPEYVLKYLELFFSLNPSDDLDWYDGDWFEAPYERFNFDTGEIEEEVEENE